MVVLSWPDDQIMECDLRRLNIAIDAAVKARNDDTRFRAKLAGWDVEEPVPEPQTDEEFNQSARAAMAAFKRRSKSV